jgi:hypothetical protein
MLFAALALGGCERVPSFEHQTSFDWVASARFFADGSGGQLEKHGIDCRFDAVDGWDRCGFESPVQWSSGADEVVDINVGAFGPDTILLRAEGGLFVLSGTEFSTDGERFDVSGVVSARLTRDGVVLLVSEPECQVEWADDSLEVLATVAVGGCPGTPTLDGPPPHPPFGFDVDWETGTAIVGSEDGVALVDPSYTTMVDAGGDLVAWDGPAGVGYTAEARGDLLTAFDGDGEVLWQVSPERAVDGLAAAQGDGGVLVSMSDAPDSDGRIELRDADGTVLLSAELPSSVVDPFTSADGGTIGMWGYPGSERELFHVFRLVR